MATVNGSASVQGQSTKRVAFAELWENYPHKTRASIQRRVSPLTTTNVPFASGWRWSGPGCLSNLSRVRAVSSAAPATGWFCERRSFMKRPFAGCPADESKVPKEYEKALAGRTGIVFFEDYWYRSKEAKTPGGDHIDLWSRSRLTSSWANNLRRFGLNWVPQPFGGNQNLISDLRDSKRVLFWSFE